MQDLIGSWTAWEIHNQYSLMICSFAFYQSSYSWQAEGAGKKYVDLNSSAFAIRKITYNSKCLVTGKSDVITKMCTIAGPSTWVQIGLQSSSGDRGPAVTRESQSLDTPPLIGLDCKVIFNAKCVYFFLFLLFEINEAPGFA